MALFDRHDARPRNTTTTADHVTPTSPGRTTPRCHKDELFFLFPLLFSDFFCLVAHVSPLATESEHPMPAQPALRPSGKLVNNVQLM
jgi:hypothetical protein